MQPISLPTDASEQCVEIIRERCGVYIHDLQTTVNRRRVVITGQIGSWHGKQLASEAARKLFPDCRIENRLQVIKPR